MDKGLLGFSRFLLFALILLSFCSGNGFAQAASGQARLEGNVPPALQQAAYVGHHDPTSTLDITVALKLRNTDQLQQFLQAVQDPASSEYHHFLTSQQFDAMYSPTADAANEVVSYLERQGLHVTGVSPDNKLIHVRAQSGAIERALGVQINDYEYRGRRVHATVGSPKFPVDIAGSVEAVLGLSNLALAHPALVLPPFAAPSSSTPIGYSPLQIATAYNWPSLTDTSIGAGITIAILEIDAPNVLSSDYTGFWNYYGLPNHSVTFTTVGSNPPDIADDDIETTLDLEYAGAMAPGATLDVYDGATDKFDETSQLDVFVTMIDGIVSDGDAQVMTISYIFDDNAIDITPDSDPLQAADDAFVKGVAQGMAIIAADGDGGSDNEKGASPPCDDYMGNIPVYPAGDPYVLAAGGTTLTLNGNNTIASEVAWTYAPYFNNTGCYGTGGAVSNYIYNGVTYWPEPYWQVGNGVPQNGYRNFSDISMNADLNTSQAFYDSSSWSPYGAGTSVVAPELAGMIADEMSLTGSDNRLGQANSAIYAVANKYYSTDFYDVTSGSNGAYSAGPGWDYPTGWGSPNAINLIDHLSNGAAISDPQDLSAEYLGCRLNLDTYFVTWQPPQIGTPSGGYDAEYEIVGQTGWHSFDYGPGPQANIKLPPATQVGIRVRATNGQIWSAYNTDMFSTSACSPPP